jgi:hypothetical protein
MLFNSELYHAFLNKDISTIKKIIEGPCFNIKNKFPHEFQSYDIFNLASILIDDYNILSLIHEKIINNGWDEEDYKFYEELRDTIWKIPPIYINVGTGSLVDIGGEI